MGCHYVCVFFITNVIPCPDNKEWPRIWAKQFRQQIKLVMLSISVMPTSTWVTHLCINIRGLPQIVDGDGCAVVLSQYRLELGHPPHGDTPERLGPFLLVTNFPVHSMGDNGYESVVHRSEVSKSFVLEIFFNFPRCSTIETNANCSALNQGHGDHCTHNITN